MAGCDLRLMHEMAVQVSGEIEGSRDRFLVGPATTETPLGAEWRFDGRNQCVPSFRIAGPWDGKGTD